MGDYGMDYQGGGGGGFNAAPDNNNGGGGGGLSQGSSSGGRGQRRSYDEQTLIPVTIRMILTAAMTREDESVDRVQLEDGRALNQVKFIGAIRQVVETSTNVILTIEDGTGLIEVKQWQDANGNQAVMEARQAAQQENTYVKVVGQIKTYQGTLSVLADSVRPLSTGNELSHHMLEVVYSAETYKRRNSYVNAPPQQQMMGMGQQQQPGVGFNSGGGGQAVAQASGGGGGGQDTAIRNLIKRYLADHDDPDGGGQTGLNKYAVGKAIAHANGSQQFQEGDVVQVMDAMSAEGDLYSTVDEDHLRLA